MAKKKAKKKTTRKVSSKKKASARTASRKTSSKRKPARKATAKRAAPKVKKSAPRKKVAGPPIPLSVEFEVDPNTCKIDPKSHHVSPKSQKGSVQLNATKACTVQFDNPGVLVLPSNPLSLQKGANGPYSVAVDAGITNFKIVDCQGPETSDPSDIIVP